MLMSCFYLSWSKLKENIKYFIIENCAPKSVGLMHLKCSFLFFSFPCRFAKRWARYNFRLFWNLFQSIKYSESSLAYQHFGWCFNVSTEKRFIKGVLLIRIVIELPLSVRTKIMVNEWNDSKKKKNWKKYERHTTRIRMLSTIMSDEDENWTGIFNETEGKT